MGKALAANRNSGSEIIINPRIYDLIGIVRGGMGVKSDQTGPGFGGLQPCKVVVSTPILDWPW